MPLETTSLPVLLRPSASGKVKVSLRRPEGARRRVYAAWPKASRLLRCATRADGYGGWPRRRPRSLRDRWLWEPVPSGPMVVGVRPFGTDGCGSPSLRDRWLWEPVPSGPMVVGARPFGTGGCVILLLPCATRSTALTKSVIVFPSRRGRAASGPNASPAVPRWPSASRRRAAADTL